MSSSESTSAKARSVVTACRPSGVVAPQMRIAPSTDVWRPPTRTEYELGSCATSRKAVNAGDRFVRSELARVREP
jgi:hypothetical protein